MSIHKIFYGCLLCDTLIVIGRAFETHSTSVDHETIQDIFHPGEVLILHKEFNVMDTLYMRVMCIWIIPRCK
jgi:hypothetical protein